MRPIEEISSELKAAREHWESCDHQAAESSRLLAEAERKVKALSRELRDAWVVRLKQVYRNAEVVNCARCSSTGRVQPHGDVCPDCFGKKP